jgi:hypothetical protein
MKLDDPRAVELARIICEHAGLHVGKLTLDQCRNWLHEHGYEAVPMAKEWETPAHLAKRLGVCLNTVSAKLRHPRCPPFVRTNTKKRIRELVSNQAVDAWILTRSATERG